MRTGERFVALWLRRRAHDRAVLGVAGKIRPHPAVRSRRCVVATIAVVVTSALSGLLLESPHMASAAVQTGPADVASPPRQGGGGKGSWPGWWSDNWAGYARSGSAISSVSADWIVPTVAATSKASAYSVAWIGIDGFDDTNRNSLIQIGTEQDSFKGRPYYRAFWEILPAAATSINSMTIHPGDLMSASITHGTGSQWTLQIVDISTQQSYSTTQNYDGPRTSAEWILEAPTVGGKASKLPTMSAVTFAAARTNGVGPRLTSVDAGMMVKGKKALATPSAPSSTGDAFSVAPGAVAPPAP